MTLYLNILQISFIITASVIVLGVLLFIILGPVRQSIIKKKYREYYYSLIYKIAVDKDYFLLNNFLFKMDDQHNALINHILFCNKYIYLINSYYFNGDITGTISDRALIYVPKKGQKKYINNPLLSMKKLLERLSMVTNLDPDLFIGIVLVNDGVGIDINGESNTYFLTNRNKFNSLIKELEARPISMIDQKQLESAVNALSQSSNKLKKKNAQSKK